MTVKRAPGYVTEGKRQKAEWGLYLHWMACADAPKPYGSDAYKRWEKRVIREAIKGTAAVPGPLYHEIVMPNGDVWLIASPQIKCNHAGRIDKARLLAMRDNRPIPVPRSGVGTTANNRLRAIALACSGKAESITKEMVASVVARCKAWCETGGHDPTVRVGDHAYGAHPQGRKVDIGSVVSMSLFRSAVVAPAPITGLRHHLIGPQEWTHPPTLKPGAQSKWVLTLRKALGVTGGTKFDRKLTATVKKFQAARRLDVDGIVGPATWAALTPPTPATIIGPDGDGANAVATSGADLGLSDTDLEQAREAVRTLQRLLGA